MHRIFSGDGWLVFLDILKSARDHRRSQRFVQQPLVLIILCILCIHVQFIILLDCSSPWRALAVPNAPIPSQRPVQRPLVLLILSLGLPLSFPAMLQPVDPGEGEGRDCERLWGGRDARAPGGLSPLTP